MIAVFLAAVLLLAFICSQIYARHWYKKLDILLSFSQSAVYAGNTISFAEQIENRKRLPLPALEVAFWIQKGIVFLDTENIQVSDQVYKRDLFTIFGMESILRRYQLDCQKRGHYTISLCTLRTWNLFFSRIRRLELPLTDELYVYAARTDVSDILRPLQSLLGEQVSRKRYLEDPFAFASIREYTPQDPMKTINWKATARTGGMMVNTYSSVENEKVMIYLDVGEEYAMRQEELTEESISVAASLLSVLEAKGLEVGLSVNVCAQTEKAPGDHADSQSVSAVSAGQEDTPVIFQPGRGREFVSRIERFLTQDFSEMKTLPFSSFQPPADDDRICVFISKHQDEDSVKELNRLTGGRRSGIWVIPVYAYDPLDSLPRVNSQSLSLVIRKVA